jgi:ABC-type branched-subunit amino acid transport system ATPase component
MTSATSDPSGTALRASRITVRFGGLVALDDVTVSAPASTITGLVGPNGAGKSTLFGVLSGLHRPNAGTVHIGDEDVTRHSPQARSRLGLARTFQQPQLFPTLTVREHLVLAFRARHARARLWRDAFMAGSRRLVAKGETERVDRLLETLNLREVAHHRAATLPLGTCRLLEVGRALALGPSVMLLDEPLSGLDVREASRLAAVLRAVVAEEQVAMLLVEHDVAMVLDLSSSIYVLDFGQIIASGSPNQIRADQRVRDAYLGDFDHVRGSSAAITRGKTAF